VRIWISYFSESEEVLAAEDIVLASVEKVRAFDLLVDRLAPYRGFADVEEAVEDINRAKNDPARRSLVFSTWADDTTEWMVTGWVQEVELEE
jgi:hypothetical protein